MARFNAAFMSGSVDEKFQNRYNYLLDLLDTGYIVEKMIGNSMSRIEVSPSVGIKISYGTTDMLSIDPTTGDLRVSGDIYVERLRASGSDDYMGFVKYGWGDTAVNFVTGDNDLPVQNMTEYLSITGDADTFTSSMITILDSTPRFATTEVKRNFATTLRVGVNQSLSAMDEENTAYLTVNGNAANPYISLTAVGATFATRSELKVESNNITFNGNKVWHSGNDGSGSGLDADLLDGLHGSSYAPNTYHRIREISSASVGAVGWRRAFTLTFTSSNDARGVGGYWIDITLSRIFGQTSNEVHRLSYYASYGAHNFVITGQSIASKLLTQIRTVRTDDTVYIDVYYNGSVSNPCKATINGYENSWGINISSNNFVQTEASPSGTITTQAL